MKRKRAQQRATISPISRVCQITDGNGVELQVDNFGSVDELNNWFASGAFSRTQFGAKIDMDDISRRLREGVPEPDLLMPEPETVEA